MEVINEKDNKLFNRKEIQIDVEAEVTPSHEEAKKLISEKFSAQPENIRVKKIAGKFGSKIFEISANIYSSKEDLKKTEFFSKKELEKQKSAEQPAEEKKEVPVKETSLEKEQEVSNEIAKEEAVEEKANEQIEEVKEKIKEETKSE